jgi:hypothetical protein
MSLHIVQGESSTGAHQSFAGVAEACRAHDTVCHWLHYALSTRHGGKSAEFLDLQCG